MNKNDNIVNGTWVMEIKLQNLKIGIIDSCLAFPFMNEETEALGDLATHSQTVPESSSRMGLINRCCHPDHRGKTSEAESG